MERLFWFKSLLLLFAIAALTSTAVAQRDAHSAPRRVALGTIFPYQAHLKDAGRLADHTVAHLPYSQQLASAGAPLSMPQTIPAEPTLSATGAYTIYLSLIAKAAAGVPVITSFSASPASIAPGGTSILSWSVSGATGLSISPGVGPVTGSSIAVSPSTTTEYTLTATNAAGSATAKTTVTVTNGDSEAIPFFLPRIAENDYDGPSVAVDGAGGVHVAYAAYTPDANGKRPAYYAYCRANCATTASFSLASLSDYVDHVNLALDSQGRPRMLLAGPGAFTNQGNTKYAYAACDAACADSANWTVASLGGFQGLFVTNSRFFALDPQGRPRFVYYDSNTALNHSGTFYKYCDANCTSATSWSEVKLSNDALLRPSLAFTAAGQTRLAAYIPSDPFVDSQVVYLECDTTCTTWTGIVLFRIESTNGWFTLRLNSNNRPRIAFYTGEVSSSNPLKKNTLYYIGCSTACTDPNAHDWNGDSLGLPALSGKYVDLVFDSQNRPRLAYEVVAQGLEYAWCRADCDSTNPSWQTRVVERNTDLDASFPVAPAPGCTSANWFVGRRVSLALDPTGNPRFGYDAEHESRGGLCPTEGRTDLMMVRFALFNQP